MELPPILAGAVVATLVMLLAWRPWRATAPANALGALATCAGTLLACFAASWVLSGPPPLVPTKALHWLLWLSLASLPMSLALVRGRRGLARGLRVATLAVLLWRILPAVIRYEEWGARAASLWCGGLWLLGWLVMESGARLGGPAREESSSAWEAASWLIWGAAITLALGTTSGEAALLMAAVCTLFGASLVAGLWRPQRSPWRGASDAPSFLLFGTVVITSLYASLPRSAAAALLSAPLAAACLGLIAPERLGPKSRLVALLLLVAIGLWLARPEPDPYGY